MNSAKIVVLFSAGVLCFLLLLPLSLIHAQTLSLPLEEEGVESSVDEADQILTNKRLRAEAGSLSRFSVKAALTYLAGTVERPFNAERPNISGGNETQNVLQKLEGTVGVKYRLNARSALNFNGGLRALTPFNRSVQDSDPELRHQFEEYGGQVVFHDPALEYSYMFRVFGVQNYLAVSQFFITDPVLREIGALTGTSLMHSVAYEVGTTRFTLGLDWGVIYQWFDKGSVELALDQTDYQVGFFPFVEYVLTDRIIFRTVLGYILEHTREYRDPFFFRRDLVYQSVGVGFSLTRDIYIYPNVQFLPADIRGDRTNVALQTFLNVF